MGYFKKKKRNLCQSSWWPAENQTGYLLDTSLQHNCYICLFSSGFYFKWLITGLSVAWVVYHVLLQCLWKMKGN